ncbi:hypothetical protein [Bifidobacterium simiarum]|uniref:Uncharacterized protein n=1 Tax=Bifidobacterium simiarum TaxID=2045441 RepID=A0A2M9HHC1_9BIFI|nr:hypothetical protein [Bifidobacterium simiarum]MBT1165292.1 hypothetical protein [Bifidobacterium simiarum]PJM76183.1 hypothetical protein CSQ87_01295 [Bifidobacterium simiarum]
MKAVIWKDWLLCKRTRMFWVVIVGVAVGYVVGASIFSSMLGSGYGGVVLMLLGPCIAYIPPVLTAGLSYPNTDTTAGGLSGTLREDGTIETVRCSGRSMAGYLMAKSVMPMIVAVMLFLPMFAYCLWGGALPLSEAFSVPTAYALGAAVLLTFVNQQILLATRANTAGALHLMVLVTLIPVFAFMVLFMVVPYWAALAIMLAFGALAAAVSVTNCRRRHPNTLTSLVPTGPTASA